MRDWEYRHYVANSLYYGAKQDERYAVKLSEILDPKPVNIRSGDEIAIDIIQGAGLILEE